MRIQLKRATHLSTNPTYKTFLYTSLRSEQAIF